MALEIYGGQEIKADSTCKHRIYLPRQIGPDITVTTSRFFTSHSSGLGNNTIGTGLRNGYSRDNRLEEEALTAVTPRKRVRDRMIQVSRNHMPYCNLTYINH